MRVPPSRRTPTSRDTGFTLVELLVVITILGILTAVVVFSVRGLNDQAEETATSIDSRIVQTAEQAFCAKNGHFGTVDELVPGFLRSAPTYTAIFVDPYDSATSDPSTPKCGDTTFASVTAHETAYPYTMTQPDGSTVVIPAEPKRIVTVGNATFPMEEIAALGAIDKLVGGQSFGDLSIAGNTSFSKANFDARGIPWAVADKVPGSQGYTNVGDSNFGTFNPNAATVASLNPDLIVGNQAPNATVLGLKSIAPLLANDLNAAATGSGVQQMLWYRNFMELSRVLNKQKEAVAFLNSFESAVDGVRASLTGKSVSIVMPNSANTNVTALGGCQNYARFLAHLGLTIKNPPAGGVVSTLPGGCQSTISPSLFDKFNGDYLLVAAVNDKAWQTLAGVSQHTFLANPLVQSLPSYVAGRVLSLAGPTFGPGNGPAPAGLLPAGYSGPTLPWYFGGPVPPTTPGTPVSSTPSTGPFGIHGPLGELYAIPYVAAAFAGLPPV